MAKIEYIAFGGQDELNKECSALIIDDEIFVFNAGVSIPLGVGCIGLKQILPDYSYLIDNKQRIKAIFLPIVTYENIAGLGNLLKNIDKKTPIVTSQLGKEIVTQLVKFPFNDVNFITMNPSEIKKFGKTDVFAFRTQCHVPGSLGFSLKTNNGCVVYFGDFVISTNGYPGFDDVIVKLNQFSQSNNILLLTNVNRYIGRTGFANPNYNIVDFIDLATNDFPSRLIVAIDQADLYKLIVLAAFAAKKSIPLVFYNVRTLKIFQAIQKLKFFNSKNLILLSMDKIDQIGRCIVVVSDYPMTLYQQLEKITQKEDAKLKLTNDDIFVYAMETINGYEKYEADTFDNLNKNKIKQIIKMPKSILTMSGCQEDQKFLVNLLKPKYIIPVNGLYMDLLTYQNIVGFLVANKQNVLKIENGQIVTFKNGELVSEKIKKITLHDQYLNDNSNEQENVGVIFERQQMSTDGSVLASVIINSKTNTISHFNFIPVGIVDFSQEKYVKAQEEINKFITDSISEILKQNKTGEKINKIQISYIKKQFMKIYDKKFGKKPLILLTIMYYQR